MGVREQAQVVQKNVSDDVCRDDGEADDGEADDGGAEGAGDDDAVMTPCCGTGRVWIFLVLGFLAMVFSAVLSGIYVNLGWQISTMDGLGFPAFVPAAVSGTTGLLISLLCWKRYKILTYAAVVFCAVAVVLSAAIAVLTSTNLLQPLLSVSKCEYSRSRTECRCARLGLSQNLQLEEGNNDGQLYLTLAGVMGCEDVHRLLPRLLYIVIGLYGVIALVCLLAGVISTLVYRTERSHVQHPDRHDQYSPLSSVSSGERDILLADTATPQSYTAAPQPHTAALFNTHTSPQMLTHRYTSIQQCADDSDSINDGNAAITDPACNPSVYPTDMCRSKRCQSFNQPRPVTLQESCVRELASCQTASVADGDKASRVNFTQASRGAERTTGTLKEHSRNTQGTLKEHRRTGRRAVTLHGLDRDQLLLILRLHMRYLQESDQQAHTEDENNGVHTVHTSQPSVMSGQQECPVTSRPSVMSGQHECPVTSRPSVMSGQHECPVTSRPSVMSGQHECPVTSRPSVNQDLLNNKHATGADLNDRSAKHGRPHSPQPGQATHEYTPQLPSPSLSLSEQFKPFSPGRYADDVSLSPGRYADDVFQIGRHDFSSNIQLRPAEPDNVLSSFSCCHPAISTVSNTCSEIGCLEMGCLEMGCTRNLKDSPANPSLTHADTLAINGTSAEAADKVQPLGTDFQDSHNSQSWGLHHTSQTSWPTQSDQQTSSSDVRKLIYVERHKPSDQEFSRNQAGTLSKECNSMQIKPRSFDLHRPAVNSLTLESEPWQISKDVCSSQVLRTPFSPGHSQVLPEFSHASLLSHQTPRRASDGNCHDTSLLPEFASSAAEDSLELRQSLAAYTGHFIESTPAAYTGHFIESTPAAYSGHFIESTPAAYTGHFIESTPAAYSGHFIESTPGKQLLLSNVPPFFQELTNSQLNTKHMTDFCSPPQHMFTPIRSSSADSGSNNDQICSPAHKPHSTLSHGQTSAHSNIRQVATEASRRTEHRFEPPARNLQPTSDSPDHQLRQSCDTDDQTQMDAVTVNFQCQSSSGTLSERLHPSFTHEQTRRSQKELEHRSAPDRSSSGHHMYAQAPRSSHTNGTSMLDMTDGNPTDPHIWKFQPEARHCNSRHQNQPTQPDINSRHQNQPTQPDINSRHQNQPDISSRHQNQPDINSRHQTQPTQPDINSRHQNQPTQPDINSRHQNQPDINSRHQNQPDINSRHQNQPTQPDINSRHQNQPTQPDINSRHQNQPDINSRHRNQPDINSRHQNQHTQPDINSRHQNQPTQPDINSRHQNQPDINSRHQNQPTQPDINSRHQNQPDINSRHQNQPTQPDINSRHQNQPDINSRHQNQPTQPDINSRQSAFCVIGGSRKSGTSFCRFPPEVDAPHVGPHSPHVGPHSPHVGLHSPRSLGWHRDHPPLSVPARVQGHISLQWGARQPGSRSVSTSSCQLWSSSHMQARTSDSWLADSRQNLPLLTDRIHGGNRQQASVPTQANQISHHGANQSPYQGANQSPYQGANQSHRFYTLQYGNQHQEHWQWADNQNHQQADQGSSKELNNNVPVRGHRQRSANIRRGHSLAERHKSRPAYLSQTANTGSLGDSQQHMSSNKLPMSSSHAQPGRNIVRSHSMVERTWTQPLVAELP